MRRWIVHGGSRLSGELEVQGSKNAVLPIMAASLLNGGETTLTNCPELLDVFASVDILRHLGCRVERQKGGTIYIDSSTADVNHIPHELMLKMRSSVMFMGAILGRMGEVKLSKPGGCELGSRPIDLHIKALRELGAQVSEEGGEVWCRAAQLKGCHLHLSFPSVGATENIMLAACTAEGETVLSNAACEPEIADLQNYLNMAGAEISGAGTPVIRIMGRRPGRSCEYEVMPDRIAAATYLCAAACAGGEINLIYSHPEHIQTLTSSLREMGCGIICGKGGVRIRCAGALKAPHPVITRPYPGFPTDAQALLMAACLKAEGTSVFVENIFENRYRHAAEMNLLGADIKTEGTVAMVCGVERLNGANVTASDLRGGAALILAGLSAEGCTHVYDSGHVQRGYEDIAGALRSLGADVYLE